ncbi:hypothetical protein FRC08_000837 [Ceratobasidium sp. 394]|nr:hypothetical protein FRC08_000837 [Ceratobasidium sp. 394]KAG9098282.1 hypothetical protein FS749_004224 [Ceratobasidium sp. UAMH 11750]
MASVTLKRAAQRATALRHSTHLLARSIASTPARHDIRSPLYEAQPLRIPRPEPSLARLNIGLEVRARDANIPGAIGFWNSHIETGTRPDGNSYLALLNMFAKHRLFRECVKVFEDMVAMGVGDKLSALNLVMLSATENAKHVSQTLSLFASHNIIPDATTYQYQLVHLDRNDNLERAMQLLDEMDTRGIAPNKECIRIVILMAARLNMPTLAMELATNSSSVVGKVDNEVTMAILMSAAASMNVKVTKWAWPIVSQTDNSLTEPLCIDILNLANRHGLPDLATSVLSYFQRERITVQEHHLAPLIGAYCAVGKGKLEQAFLALDKFREHGVEILPETTSVLVGTIGKSTESLDAAYDVLLSLPRPVNIDAVNATLQAAAITLSDLPRAIGIYKDLSTLEATPTTHTFDILLAGCLKAPHRALGERLFEDMLQLGLKPSVQTYARLILLSLTEVEYESAFERLEEMKEKKMTPPLSVYEALVRRLVEEGDPRADLALEDMEHCGYRVTPALRDFLLGNEGEGAVGRPRRGRRGQNGGNRRGPSGESGRPNGENRTNGRGPVGVDS